MSRALVFWLLAGCRLGFDVPAEGIAGDAAGDTTTPSDDGAAPTDGPSGARAHVASSPVSEAPSGATATGTVPGPLAAGTAIVVSAWTWANNTTGFAPTSVTDNVGTSYALAAVYRVSAGACATGEGAVGVYVGQLAAAKQEVTVSVTPTGDASQQVTMQASAYAGLSLGNIVGASGMTALAASPMAVPTSSVGGGPGGALLVAVGSGCMGYPDPQTWTADASWTVRAAQPVTQSRAPGYVMDRVVTNAGPHSLTWQVSYAGTGPHGPALWAIVAIE